MGTYFEKLGGAVVLIGGLILSLLFTKDPEHAVGMNFWFVFGLVAIVLGFLALVYGVTMDLLAGWRPPTRAAREDQSAPSQPSEVRAQGYARKALPGWLVSYVMNDGELKCEVYGSPKQVLRECTVTNPDGWVGVARPSRHEPQGHFAFWYPRDFEYAPPNLPLLDGEYRVEWIATGDLLIRVHSIRIAKGMLGE